MSEIRNKHLGYVRKMLREKNTIKVLVNTLLVVTVASLLTDSAWGTVGDLWNARVDWSDINNPNELGGPRYGSWSYHSINSDLMVQAFGDCGGSPADWSTALGDCPNLFNNNWTPGGSHGPYEFCGHGPWMVRWTSPIDGFVEVRGKIWQKFETSRRMAYYLRQNGGIPFDHGYVLQDGSGNTILGPDGKVVFSSIFRPVSIGDTIDFMVDGSGPGGSGVSTFTVGKLLIEHVDESEVPLPPAVVDGDINRDRCVNVEDLAYLALRWLDTGCSIPRWCEGSDIDESQEVDFGDFAYIGQNWDQCIRDFHNLGYIVVTPGGPLDGGDFGPATFGTQTSGLQEAFDSGSSNGKDIFIVGGGVEEPHGVSGPVVYFLDTTLTVPSAQNWRILGGDYVMNFNMSSGDCLVFDSQKNSEFKFSLIVAPQIEDGSLIRIMPQTNDPDGQKIFSNNILTITASVGGGDVFGGGVDGTGIGLHLDASEGAIVHNKIFCQEPIACEIGLLLEGGDVRNNSITCPFLHICNNSIVVRSGSYNRIEALIEGNGVLNPPIGADILGGQQNTYDLVFAGGFGIGDSLVFGLSARDNIVYANNLLFNGITNNSAIPTNRIVSNKPVGFNVITPTFPTSGADLENQSSFTVVATITSTGTVSSWMLTDAEGASQTINAGLYAGQQIYLEPGETINFNHSSAPAWRWQALR